MIPRPNRGWPCKSIDTQGTKALRTHYPAREDLEPPDVVAEIDEVKT